VSFNGISSLLERRKGTYAAVKYDDAIMPIIEEWGKLWKIPNLINPSELHTTVIYSRVVIPKVRQTSLDRDALKSLGWRFLPTQLKLLDDALVIMLEAPELIEVHEKLVKQGATHDYVDYIPHVTIAYDVPVEFDWSTITPPPIYFIPIKLYFEPLDLNWKSE